MEDGKITDPVIPPTDPKDQPGPNIGIPVNDNPLTNFWNNPANANMIAVVGWAAILSTIYIYLYGAPKIPKKSDNRNYQQQESASTQQSREERLKKLQADLDASAAERKAAKAAEDEAKRQAKAETARLKYEAMTEGAHFSGNSHSLADDTSAEQEALEQAAAAKKRRQAAKSNKLRDDDYNPLSGSSESRPRYRNTTAADCGPRGG